MAPARRFEVLRSPRLYVYPGLALVLAWIASTVIFDLGRGPVGSQAPEFQGIHRWINSEPLSLEELRSSVVLVDFWTYTCVNCIRTFPYLKDWQRKYSGQGLVIVGVHAPEFEFEDTQARGDPDQLLLHPVVEVAFDALALVLVSGDDGGTGPGELLDPLIHLRKTRRDQPTSA